MVLFDGHLMVVVWRGRVIGLFPPGRVTPMEPPPSAQHARGVSESEESSSKASTIACMMSLLTMMVSEKDAADEIIKGDNMFT